MSWKRIGLVYAVIVIAAGYVALSYARDRWAFGLNMTESLPHWAFLADADVMPRNGELVMFDPPENPYYDGAFVKRIVGVAGDRIEVQGRRVYVAGVFVGEAKPVSQDGRALVAISPQVIPEGYVYVAGTHIDSYDSRYEEIGLIPIERIVGRAYPIL
ncbi:signal peptidase I [Henriciella pelagia]|uniref:Signal peptidase I n=1 Tax=Maricaulis virginensis TaxID=144022 RepID=A0A9W6IQ31_9PROT|nr:hypothetical protein GCM10017621_30470 [Maricaulis virginensis]